MLLSFSASPHTVTDVVVSLRFTEEVLTVRESEGEGKLCVSKSHVIAKPLNFVIIHDSVTSGRTYSLMTSIIINTKGASVTRSFQFPS